MDLVEDMQTLAAGWYFEWEINDQFLLVIKSTSQEDDILQGETDQVVEKMKKVMYSDSIAFKQWYPDQTN